MSWKRIVLFGVLLASQLAIVQAADWPHFRGPTANGVVEESRLPADWGKDKNIRWKTPIPGVGWSSPVVWGDKVFVTTAVTDKQAKPKPFGGGVGFGRGKDFGPGGGGFGKGGFGKQAPPNDVYKFQLLCLERDTGKVL